MDYTDEEFYMLALSLMDEFTAYQKIKMLEEKGSAEAVFLDLGKTEFYPHHRLQQIQNVIQNADMECELMAKNNIHAIFAKNIEFPFRLRNCPDYPLVLFHKGKLDANRRYALSIVGSRKADKKGERRVCEMLDYLTLYKDNMVIVAGVASGIDAMVLNHAQSLGFYTICVIPHGFGHRYDCNVEKRINSASCVVSENRFLFGYGDRIYEQRNRIIVGLSDAVVVAQAKNGNGAGLYVGKALDYNRDCFAFIYPNENSQNEKCNLFVEQDQAIPLYSSEEFLDKMIWPWGMYQFVIRNS